MHDFKTAADHAIVQQDAADIEALADHVCQILLDRMEQFDRVSDGMASRLVWSPVPLAAGDVRALYCGKDFDLALQAADGLRAFVRAIGMATPTANQDFQIATAGPLADLLGNLADDLYAYVMDTPDAAAHLIHAAEIARELEFSYSGWPVGVDVDLLKVILAGARSSYVPVAQMLLEY